MENRIKIYLIMGSLLISSCASTQKSVFTGMGVGAMTGAATGIIINKRNKEKWALQGLVIGATLGGSSAYVVHHSLKKRDEKIKKETLLRFNEFMSSMSFEGDSRGRPRQNTKERGVKDFKVATPEVDKNCSDWEIKGNRLVEGHCVWVIHGQSFWLPVSGLSSSFPSTPSGSLHPPHSPRSPKTSWKAMHQRVPQKAHR